MDTPATPNDATTPAGDPGARPRRRRRIVVVLLLFLALELAGILAVDPEYTREWVSALSTGRAEAAGVGEGFVITGAVTAFPACTGPAALLPGVDQCLVYTVHNPGSQPITVTAISISEVGAPAACAGDNVDVARSSFAGALTVASGATVVVPGRPIALLDSAADLDGCRGATFTFRFTGTARQGAGAP